MIQIKMSLLLMKQFPLFLLMVCSMISKAQKIDSIFFNLYTDSLKKGSWNYINVEGKQVDGKYIPLNNKQLIITATAGKLEGNSVWLDWDFKSESITVEVKLKDNPSISQKTTIWVKKYDLQLNAPVQDSLLQQINNRQKKQPPSKKKKN